MMPELNTAPNMASPDDFYALLLEAHAGMSAEDSGILNAKLILLLANHIGDLNVLKEALRHAAKALPQEKR